MFQKYVYDQSTNKLMDMLIMLGILKGILVNKTHIWVPTSFDGEGQDCVVYYFVVD